MNEWTNGPVLCLLCSLFYLIVAHFKPLIHAWFYVHFLFIWNSSTSAGCVKWRNVCSVINCKCCGFKHTRLQSWHFCGRGLWTVAFRPELVRQTPTTRNRNVNQSDQTFGLKRYKANGSHMPYCHGYVFTAQRVPDVRDGNEKGNQKTILQCLTLQQNHSSRTTVITSLCEVWCSHGDNYEHCCVLGLNVGRIADGHATNVAREFAARDSSESLVPTEKPSAWHHIRQCSFCLSAKQRPARDEHLNVYWDGTYQSNGMTNWMTLWLTDCLNDCLTEWLTN